MTTKALLVYPETPPTYWSMRHALPFLGRKSALPPLGLLTVASLLPSDWEIRVLDQNVENLRQEDIRWADLVFISAMLVQRPAFERTVALCRELGTPVVAGGPYPTSCHASIQGVDHFVLGEAEVNLPSFLDDFKRGVAGPLYFDPSHPDIRRTPAPRYDLVDRKNYAGAALQFSRGCPYHCEFCDIVELFGRLPRTKSPEQFIAELEQVYSEGWMGSLFIVDDNFIGNRIQVKRLLVELRQWQEKNKYPYSFFTEASIDLAEDASLMDDMVMAGFNMVFIGLETPDATTLTSIKKTQNLRADMVEEVHAIQGKGLEVAGGFILGFDDDKADIFDRQVRFIQDAAIPTAMVGLLTPLPGTRLHARLATEGRLLKEGNLGNNTHDLELAFLPRMNSDLLLAGYRGVLQDLYTPKRYFARCLDLIRRMRPGPASCRKVGGIELRALFYSLFRQTFSHYGGAYVSYLVRALVFRPRMMPEIMAFAIKGHHFFTITDEVLSLEGLRKRMEAMKVRLEDRIVNARGSGGGLNVVTFRLRLLRQAWSRCSKADPDIRASAMKVFNEFKDATGRMLEERGGANASLGLASK